MKKLVLFLLASTCALISYSQKANYIQFKLYKNVAFELGQTQGTRTIELGTFSPAIAWGKNENFHEIQLLSVNFFSRSRARNYSAGAEYSYNYCFSDDKQSKVQVYLGGGVGGSFASNYSEIFRGSTAVPSKGVFINTHLIALPRITYRLKSNILLDLSLPYKIMTYENSQLVEEDPSIPVNQQTTTINVTNFFPSALSLKIGTTVRF